MSKQSYSDEYMRYMRPQDRDDSHHDVAPSPSRKGRGRSPQRNREERSRGRSCDSYGQRNINHDRYMGDRSGRDHYNRSTDRYLAVPPSYSHRSRSCDPRPRAYLRPPHNTQQSNSSKSRKRYHSSDPHHLKYPNNVRFDQPQHRQGSTRDRGLKDIHHETNVSKDTSYEHNYPLAPSRSNEANMYQASAKRPKHINASHVDKENRLNTYYGHNDGQRSRLRHSSTSYEPHLRQLASRQGFSAPTHLPHNRKVPHLGSISTIPDLIWTAHDHLDNLTSASIAAFWNTLSKQMSGENPTNTHRLNRHEDLGRCLHQILERTMSNLGQFNGKDLSQTIYSMAKLTCTLRKNERQTFSDVLKGCFLTSDESMKKDIFRSLAVASKDTLDSFDARGVSNLAYSYALIGYVPKFLFDHIATNAAELMSEFNSQGLANTVWAYAKAGVFHSKLFQKVADHIVASNILDQFNSQDLANTVWAYATANVSHHTLFEKLADHIVASSKLDQFNSQDLANTVWAYAKADIHYPKLFEKVADHIVASNILDRFNSQGLANTVWAYANMGTANRQLFSSIALTASKSIYSFNSQDLLNMAWAFAVADIDFPSLFNDHFFGASVEEMRRFSVGDLSQLHQWHLWRSKEMSRDGLPEALMKLCFKAFVSQDPTESTLQKNVVTQLSAIGLNPDHEVFMDSGYSIDAVVKVNGRTIGVEVDGPSHFIGRSKSPAGSTMLKRRQVSSIDGIELVSVPYWEWDELGKDKSKEQKYLRRLLKL